MADQQSVYNPLDEEHVEQVAGTKPRGLEKEIHEGALPPVGVLELNLERYVGDFNERIIGAYAAGTGERSLPADVGVARSLIPPGTGALRDFSYIAPEIPLFDHTKCVGCMSCVTECPDTAILGKAIPRSHLEAELNAVADPRSASRSGPVGRDAEILRGL
ncbi:MAG: 4Fe-4S binding protein [Candidatus Methylomirabilis sp.]|nr:4Fe-4S binding protein [Candidatus Methylomirabilis sp.]